MLILVNKKKPGLWGTRGRAPGFFWNDRSGEMLRQRGNSTFTKKFPKIQNDPQPKQLAAIVSVRIIRKLLKYMKKMERLGVSRLFLGMCQAIDPPTILVVEDEPFIRMSTVTTLEDEGFSVLQAQNSAEALDILSRHPEVNILITDVRMPGLMDGLALVARVQIDYPAIRSIVVSGNTSAEQASNAGALGFVAKPYLAQTILQAVHDTVLRN
jgi:two-component system, response regulator PdtaR